MASKAMKSRRPARQDADLTLHTSEFSETTSLDEGEEGEPRITRSMASEAKLTTELLHMLVQQQQIKADRREEDRQLRAEEAECEREIRAEEADLQRERRKEEREQARAVEERFMKMFQTVAAENDRPKLQPPKLPPFKDGEDIDIMLHKFEQHMTAYSVPKRQWVAHLRPLLEGEALTAFLAIPVDETDDYTPVKEAILHRFGLTQDVYRKRWWQATFKPKEMGLQMANRLKDL